MPLSDVLAQPRAHLDRSREVLLVWTVPNQLPERPPRTRLTDDTPSSTVDEDAAGAPATPGCPGRRYDSGARHMSGGGGRLVIVATLCIAMLLTILPMPEWARPFRPQWVTLVMLYWRSHRRTASAWAAALLPASS